MKVVVDSTEKNDRNGSNVLDVEGLDKFSYKDVLLVQSRILFGR
jgi:hypothetical protein